MLSQNCQEKTVNDEHDEAEREQIEHQDIDPVSFNCIWRPSQLHVSDCSDIKNQYFKI